MKRIPRDIPGTFLLVAVTCAVLSAPASASTASRACGAMPGSDGKVRVRVKATNEFPGGPPARVSARDCRVAQRVARRGLAGRNAFEVDRSNWLCERPRRRTVSCSTGNRIRLTVTARVED